MKTYLRFTDREGKVVVYDLGTGEEVVPIQCDPPKKSLAYEWNVKFEQK